MRECTVYGVEILYPNKLHCSLSLSTDTFFVEFKSEALTWSPDLTKEYHNTFINTANKIVGIVSRFSRITKLFCLRYRTVQSRVLLNIFQAHNDSLSFTTFQN